MTMAMVVEIERLQAENAQLRDRVAELEVKCDLLSASLAKQDFQVTALQAEVDEAKSNYESACSSLTDTKETP